MPPTETMMMDLLIEAWQYFWQNCESILRRMECHVEVLLTTEVKELREPYSQQTWQNCIHSCNVVVHASFSVDCGWTCQVKVAEIHIRNDAKNLVTTARTTHLPERKETILMNSMLRKEACSGSIHDLAHISIQNWLANQNSCFRRTAKAPNLIEDTIIFISSHEFLALGSCFKNESGRTGTCFAVNSDWLVMCWNVWFLQNAIEPLRNSSEILCAWES